MPSFSSDNNYTMFLPYKEKKTCFKAILNYPLTEVRGITAWKKHKMLEATWQHVNSPTPTFAPILLNVPIGIEKILLLIYSFTFPNRRAFEREAFCREVECAVIIFLA